MGTHKLLKQTKDTLTVDMQAVAENRDEQAFSRLFDHFLPLVKSYVWAKQPGSSTIVNEVSQEVMIKIWQKAHTYNPEKAAVSTWVYTLARNARIDYLRKNSKHESNIDPEFVWDSFEDEADGPLQQTLKRRTEQNVYENISELPQDQRQVIHKVYIEGKTHEQAAVDLVIPLGTVKSRIRLALKKLSILIKQ